MAPFIPQGLINPELNLFFALIIGFGFGYILEQAGFSSSRKLAGVFYGYDFVVLRVFFTAGITAMTGLLFLSYFGWLDMSLIYINPTYLWSAIIGGVIMGFGFILGGFCPGTSIVAAVIGKIDAMIFIVGVFIGIFIFGHYYHSFEHIYTGHFLGHPFIYETLGMSKKWFAFLLASMALMAFVFTKILEDKTNKADIKQLNERPNYTLPAFLLMFLMAIHLFLPEERRSSMYERAPEKIMEMYHTQEFYMDADEAAYNIMHNKSDFVLIDVRDEISVNHFRFPGALHIPVENIFDRQWRRFFNDSNIRKVFYSDGESSAVAAWLMAARAGYDNIFVLKGGLNGFFEKFFISEISIPSSGNMMEEYEYRFVSEARRFFLEGGAVMKEKKKPVPVKKLIEISVPEAGGGC